MAGTTKAAAKSNVAHPSAEAQETGAASSGATDLDIEFDQIQGNVFGGFNKDHQLNIFLKVTDKKKAVASLRPKIKSDDVPDSISVDRFGFVYGNDSSVANFFAKSYVLARTQRILPHFRWQMGEREATVLSFWPNANTSRPLSKGRTRLRGRSLVQNRVDDRYRPSCASGRNYPI